MRVRFKPDAMVSAGGGRTLALAGKEAEVSPAPDGRFEFIIPEGEMAGEKIYVDGDLFEILE